MQNEITTPAIKYLAMMNSLNRFLMTSGLAIALGFSAAQPSISQTVDEKILTMEQRLEAEYETYFERDLANVSQSPSEIAKTLAAMGEATNTTPAVIWAMPREDHLHLVLITPNGVDNIHEPVVATAATNPIVSALEGNPPMEAELSYLLRCRAE